MDREGQPRPTNWGRSAAALAATRPRTLEKPEATQRSDPEGASDEPSAPQAVFMPAGGQPDTLVRPTTAEKVVETRKGLAS